MTAAAARDHYSAAVIGCGRIGSAFADDPLMGDDIISHAQAYSVCHDTTLAAIVDTDSQRLNDCGERWGVNLRCGSVAALVAGPVPDIVSVATPTSTHFDVVAELLSGDDVPLAVICEKPLASSVEEATQLVEAARARRVLLVVLHMRRYARNMQNLRSFLREGGIGELHGVAGWLTKGTVHNGTHWFDLLRFLVGEVRSVSAVDVLREPGADPTLDVSLRLDNGMLATMRAADATRYALCEMDILGSSGRVRVVDAAYSVEIYAAAPSVRNTGYVELVATPVEMGDRRNVALHAVEDVVRCLRSGQAPLSSGEDGLAALKIALAAHESARTGAIVTLGPAGSAS